MKRLSVGLAVVLGIGSWFLANSPTGAYLWYQLRPDYPTDESQQVPLDALFEPVQIHFDEWGIAHIDAKNEHDLVRAVGWVHGRDRFFQMDAMRRIAQGRLSALVGEKPFMSGTTVDLDRTMHGWGFGRLAQQDLDTLPDEARELLAAYADGVRVFAHIVNTAADRLAMDMAVRLCVAILGEDEGGAAVESYAFTPDPEGGG